MEFYVAHDLKRVYHLWSKPSLFSTDMQQTNLEQLCDVIMTLCDQICAMNSDSSESKRPNQGLVRFNHPPPPINHCYVVNVSNAGHKMQVCLKNKQKKQALIFLIVKN